MITFQKDNYLVHYNSDGSGDAIFIIQKLPGSRDVDLEIKLPCEVIIGFVAELVRNERAAWAQNFAGCVAGSLLKDGCNNGHGGADSK